VVSTTVIAWLQVELLLQQSVACHVRVITCEQSPVLLVAVPRTAIVGLALQQASTALGVLKLQAEPHSTVLAGAQVMTGGVVSVTVMT
jgi:hypothetical protein